VTFRYNLNNGAVILKSIKGRTKSLRYGTTIISGFIFIFLSIVEV